MFKMKKKMFKTIDFLCFMNEWMNVKSLSHLGLFATPWTVAHQAPPSMGFSRQEYWSGVPLPSHDKKKKGLEIWICERTLRGNTAGTPGPREWREKPGVAITQHLKALRTVLGVSETGRGLGPVRGDRLSWGPWTGGVSYGRARSLGPWRLPVAPHRYRTGGERSQIRV